MYLAQFETSTAQTVAWEPEIIILHFPITIMNRLNQAEFHVFGLSMFFVFPKNALLLNLDEINHLFRT